MTPTRDAARAPRRNPIRRLYDWVLGWADTPHGTVALFALAVVESSFFPVPPDVLLIALALAKPERAFRYATWCTIGSVVGGVIGYGIGWGLWATVHPFVLDRVFPADKFEEVMGLYRAHGLAVVFAAAFTPIPYKIFTIAAGVAALNLPLFVGASVIGRGARFFLVALLIRTFGDRARAFIDRYFNAVTLAATALLIGGFLLLRAL
jgi:membrane protein YqaA with SNARE-associated domain